MDEEEDFNVLTFEDLLCFSYQVAKGMEFLESKSVWWRLANCLDRKESKNWSVCVKADWETEPHSGRLELYLLPQLYGKDWTALSGMSLSKKQWLHCALLPALTLAMAMSNWGLPSLLMPSKRLERKEAAIHGALCEFFPSATKCCRALTHPVPLSASTETSLPGIY